MFKDSVSRILRASGFSVNTTSNDVPLPLLRRGANLSMDLYWQIHQIAVVQHQAAPPSEAKEEVAAGGLEAAVPPADQAPGQRFWTAYTLKPKPETLNPEPTTYRPIDPHEQKILWVFEVWNF